MSDFEYISVQKITVRGPDGRGGRMKYGEIHQVDGGWQYLPQGKKKHAGPVYPSLEQLKAELEAE